MPHLPAATFTLAILVASMAGAVESTPSPDEVAQWVKELGHAQFIVRERAQTKLLKAGETAKEALEEASKNPNLEVRSRAARLLSNVRRSEFQRRVADFLAGKKMDRPLPGWASFRELAGDTEQSKLLFVDVVKGDEALLEAVESGKDVSAELAERVQDTTRNAYTAPLKEHVALVTFLAANLTAEQYQRQYSTLYSFFRNNRVADIVRGSPSLMSLFNSWLRHVLDHEDSGSSQSLVLSLVLEYDAEEIAIEFARKTLNQSGVSQGSLQHAVTCVGRFGSKSDLPLLLKHFDDKRVTNTWSRGQGKPLVKTQLKDRALAMAIHLVGKSPGDFGFPFPQTNPKHVYQVYSCGFETDEQRQQAHDNWGKWWNENRQKHMAPAPEPTPN